MSIFKRGKRGIYWYDFVHRGRRVQRSTRQGNRAVAKDLEADHRAKLSCGDAGILEREPAPTLSAFAQRFIDAIEVRSAAKPKTISFYAQQLARLLDFEPLASARLDAIDAGLIVQFVEYRTQQVSPASTNRALATLRRLLRLAQEWEVIDRVPRIRLLPGEQEREFILPRQEERLYLEVAPQPLGDVALLMLDSGLRLGEALALRWDDIHLEPANGARFGYLHVREGKSKKARRNVPLTARAGAMLDARQGQGTSVWVFAGDRGRPYSGSRLDHLHQELRQALRLPGEFVLHCLRHTYGTRLGEAGADAFTIMRLMGHSSVTVSQRYVHPTPEALERAVEKLEALNQGSPQHYLPEAPKRASAAANFTTGAAGGLVSY